jgi:hypothetical protein
MTETLEKIIDIYSKLIIGVISFIAPISSYIVSTYISGDRTKILKRVEEQKNKTNLILDDDMKDATAKGVDARQFIQNSNEKLEKMELLLEEKIKLLLFLDPRRRIGALFFWLFLSLGFVLIVVAIEGKIFAFYNTTLSALLLILSLITFIRSIFELRNTAWKLIRAKEILSDDEKALEDERKSQSVDPEK